jgi:hypothetical protein
MAMPYPGNRIVEEVYVKYEGGEDAIFILL